MVKKSFCVHISSACKGKRTRRFTSGIRIFIRILSFPQRRRGFPHTPSRASLIRVLTFPILSYPKLTYPKLTYGANLPQFRRKFAVKKEKGSLKFWFERAPLKA